MSDIMSQDTDTDTEVKIDAEVRPFVAEQPSGLGHGSLTRSGDQRSAQEEEEAAAALMQIGRGDRASSSPPRSLPVPLPVLLTEFQKHHEEMMHQLSGQHQAMKGLVHDAVLHAKRQTEHAIKSEWESQNHIHQGELQQLQETIHGLNHQLTTCMVTKINGLTEHMQQQHDHFLAAMRQEQGTLVKELGNSNQQLIETIREGNQQLTQTIEQLTRTVLDTSGSLSQSHTKALGEVQKRQFETLQAIKQLGRELADPQRNLQTATHQLSLVSETRERSHQLKSERYSAKAEKRSSTPHLKKVKHRSKKSAHYLENSSTSDESDADSAAEETPSEAESRATDRSRRHYHKHPKLTPFGGKERWKVWYKRFKFCTQGMSSKEKLEEMLPLLRGSAADFVFDQLPAYKLNSLSLLVKELDNRFRKVENPRTYRAKLSKLRQRAETVEEFAAEIKRIYDKAYPDRDIKTREEDLLQKFLEGLKDQHAASQVQFIRKLEDIDQAVDAIVNFQELHGKTEKTARSRNQGSSTDDSEEEVRVSSKKKPSPKESKSKKQAETIKAESQSQMGATTQWAQKETQTPPPSDQEEEANARRNFQASRNFTRDRPNYGGSTQVPFNRQAGGGQQTQQKPSGFSREYICFKCGGPNHIAKNCQANMMGQPPAFHGAPEPRMPFGHPAPLPMRQNSQNMPIPSASNQGYLYPQMNTGNQYLAPMSNGILIPAPVAPTQPTMSSQSGNLMGPVL
jgi:heme-degrading monooxygenase HmoA